MTQIVDALDELTPAWFSDALGIDVRHATSKFIGSGQMGSVVMTELEYEAADAGPRSVIVKLPSRDPGSRQMGAAIGVYEAEIRFYKEIAPRVDISAPKLYWGDVEPATGRFTLVLEDLSSSAEVGDMVAGGTIEQAALAIGQLAGLQAPCWHDPDLAKRPWLGDLARTEMLFAGVAPAVEPFADRFKDRIDAAHIDLVRRVAPKAASVVQKLWKPPLVITHGDYRLDNMMFGSVPGAPGVTVIDWQVTRLAPPLVDAAIFLGACLSPEQRRVHEQELLRAYHDDLLARGVKGFSFDDCWESYRVSSLYPFLLVVAMSVSIERTERGDKMWARLAGGAATLVEDLSAAELLD